MAASNPKGRKSLSKVVPILNGPVVCDVAARDPGSGKWNLIGLFNNVNAKTFPTARPMTVYLRLSDAQGRYEIEVRFVRADSGEEMGSARGEMQVSSRLDSPDIAVPFPPLPMPEPGTYEFQVWCNGVFLGSTSIKARKRAE